jgi:ABC-type Na+ efflux pump permease subunit
VLKGRKLKSELKGILKDLPWSNRDASQAFTWVGRGNHTKHFSQNGGCPNRVSDPALAKYMSKRYRNINLVNIIPIIFLVLLLLLVLLYFLLVLMFFSKCMNFAYFFTHRSAFLLLFPVILFASVLCLFVYLYTSENVRSSP